MNDELPANIANLARQFTVFHTIDAALDAAIKRVQLNPDIKFAVVERDTSETIATVFMMEGRVAVDTISDLWMACLKGNFTNERRASSQWPTPKA